MGNYLMLYLICAYLFLLGCSKDINCPPNSTKNPPSIIWRVPLGPQKYDQKTFDPVIYKEKLVMGYQSGFQKEGYYIFDKFTGKVLNDIMNIPSFDAASILLGNNYVSKVGKTIRKINLETYEVKWGELENYIWTGIFMSPFENKIFLPRFGRSGSAPKENVYEFIECDVLDEIKDKTVLQDSFKMSDGAFGTGNKYLYGRKNINNEREIYYSATLAFNPAMQKQSIYKVVAYNLDQKKIIWTTGEFSLDSLDQGILGDHIPVIIDNKIIFSFGGAHLICYDINTGEKLWNTIVDEIGSLFAHGDKISIIDNNMGRFHLIDARTGKILNYKKLDHGFPIGWAYHNNTLYFTAASSKLYAIEANTHEIKWEIKSPNTCSYCRFGFQSPVVDAETNRLYITDGLEVICYQLD